MHVTGEHFPADSLRAAGAVTTTLNMINISYLIIYLVYLLKARAQY